MEGKKAHRLACSGYFTNCLHIAALLQLVDVDVTHVENIRKIKQWLFLIEAQHVKTKR